MILTRPGSIVSLSIPDHPELARGTLRKLVRLAGVTVEEFRAAVEPHTPESAEKITGVAADDIVRAAHIYAEAPAASIVYSMGTARISGSIRRS